MTNMQFPVLASLALLGACSYEVSIGGGGREVTVFEPAKVIEAVRIRAKEKLGDPSAVRCPPRVQYVPFDRYACEADIEGNTYRVNVQHRLFWKANVQMHDGTVGLEPMAETFERIRAKQGKTEDIDCRGVVLSRTNRYGACVLDDGRDLDVVLLVNGKLMYRLEPKAAAM